MEDVITSVSTQREAISVSVIKDTFSPKTTELAKVLLSLTLIITRNLVKPHEMPWPLALTGITKQLKTHRDTLITICSQHVFFYRAMLRSSAVIPQQVVRPSIRL